MSETIFHIGYHKTGSTFLQKNVFPFIPETNYIDRKHNKDLIRKLLYQDYFSWANQSSMAYYESLLSCDKLNLISDENMVGHPFRCGINNKVILDKLAYLCPTAQVIIVIRNQLDLLWSLYNQYIRSGGFYTFKSFVNFENRGKIDDLFLDKVSLDFLKYSPLIMHYQKTFGKSNVNVLCYEDIRKNLAYEIIKVIESITRTCVSLDLNSLDIKSQPNKSIKTTQLLVKRKLNHFLRSRYNRRPRIYLGIKNGYVLQFFDKIGSFGSSNPMMIMNKEIAAFLHEFYSEDNLIVETLIGKKLPF